MRPGRLCRRMSGSRSVSVKSGAYMQRRITNSMQPITSKSPMTAMHGARPRKLKFSSSPQMKPLVYKTTGGPLSEQRHSATAPQPRRRSATAPQHHRATATAPQWHSPQRQCHSHSAKATAPPKATAPKPQRHSKSRGPPRNTF